MKFQALLTQLPIGLVYRIGEVLGYFWTVQLLILQGRGRTIQIEVPPRAQAEPGHGHFQ
jgi:hypothetical protein